MKKLVLDTRILLDKGGEGILVLIFLVILPAMLALVIGVGSPLLAQKS